MISLWTPNQDLLKNQRLAYFMSYCRRLLLLSPPLNLDISTCIDTIKAIIAGKESTTGKELSKMESIVFKEEQQGHRNQSERIEALERYMFGTSLHSTIPVLEEILLSDPVQVSRLRDVSERHLELDMAIDVLEDLLQDDDATSRVLKMSTRILNMLSDVFKYLISSSRALLAMTLIRNKMSLQSLRVVLALMRCGVQPDTCDYIWPSIWSKEDSNLSNETFFRSALNRYANREFTPVKLISSSHRLLQRMLTLSRKIINMLEIPGGTTSASVKRSCLESLANTICEIRQDSHFGANLKKSSNLLTDRLSNVSETSFDFKRLKRWRHFLEVVLSGVDEVSPYIKQALGFFTDVLRTDRCVSLVMYVLFFS